MEQVEAALTALGLRLIVDVASRINCSRMGFAKLLTPLKPTLPIRSIADER
jgi:hypothetical protein